MTNGVYDCLQEIEASLEEWARIPLGCARTGVATAKNFYDESVSPNLPGVVSEDQKSEQLTNIAGQLRFAYHAPENNLTPREKFTNYMVESSRRFSEENTLCFFISKVLFFCGRSSLLDGNYITRLNGKIINLVDIFEYYDLARFSHKIACVAANAIYALTIVSILAGVAFMSASALSVGAGITVASAFFLTSYLLKAQPVEENLDDEEDQGVEEPHRIHADFRAVLQSAEIYSVIAGVVTQALVYPIIASFVGVYVFYQHYIAIPRDVALGVHQAYLEYHTPFQQAIQ